MWQTHSLRSSEVRVQSLPILHKNSSKSVTTTARMLAGDTWPQDCSVCSGCFKNFNNFPKASPSNSLHSSASIPPFFLPLSLWLLPKILQWRKMSEFQRFWVLQKRETAETQQQKLIYFNIFF